MTTLTFHGAAQEVTGSLHLLDVDGFRIALDCGMFQGRRAEGRIKNTSWPCPPEEIDAVVLSHAHIDHSGRLPRLVREGFTGPIYATPAARDLAAVMLADSAHIQEEDANYWNKKRVKRGEEAIEPLYTQEDSLRVIEQMFGIPYGRSFPLSQKVQVLYSDAGHMLGSGVVHLKIETGKDKHVSLVFTGDLGRPNMPILRDPSALPPCDYLICESTYGGRQTDPIVDMKERLAQVVETTVKRGGKVIVPSFSVGRTQVIVYSLHQLFVEGRLKQIPVFVDSPLAVNATEVFRLHPECYDADARKFNSKIGDILGNGCCTYIRDVEESKALHRKRTPCVIISASGMCEFGRILHHLKNNIPSAKNTVLIVGYQAQHTLGRRLVEGAEEAKIFGEVYPVKAQVVVLNGFSAHANAGELKAMTAPLAQTCKHAFLVHGEMDQCEALRASLTESGFGQVSIPASGQTFELE
ncbi:MAG: MBL fold metallo-hydrolase [Phycisphaerae bacterium]|nr:MBL fold metallo-hydrolase [Phycisphaerae bacterium]